MGNIMLRKVWPRLGSPLVPISSDLPIMPGATIYFACRLLGTPIFPDDRDLYFDSISVLVRGVVDPDSCSDKPRALIAPVRTGMYFDVRRIGPNIIPALRCPRPFRGALWTFFFPSTSTLHGDVPRVHSLKGDKLPRYSEILSGIWIKDSNAKDGCAHPRLLVGGFVYHHHVA